MEPKKQLFTKRMYKTIIIWTLIAAVLALAGVFIPAIGEVVNIIVTLIIMALGLLMAIGMMLYLDSQLVKALRGDNKPPSAPIESDAPGAPADPLIPIYTPSPMPIRYDHIENHENPR